MLPTFPCSFTAEIMSIIVMIVLQHITMCHCTYTQSVSMRCEELRGLLVAMIITTTDVLCCQRSSIQKAAPLREIQLLHMLPVPVSQTHHQPIASSQEISIVARRASITSL